MLSLLYNQIMSDPAPTKPSDDSPDNEDFIDQADSETPSLLTEFVDFLATNKKWWLTPIIIVLLLVGALLVFGGSAAAPFVYTLF